jgi:NAD(P)-dependent dehydrogenase (short-subunit alcohol dehydrogenase family)
MRTQRTVVVTGAGGGIGSLLVKRFLENGDHVVATDFSADALSRLSAQLEPAHRLETIQADITSESDCLAVADCARRATARIDVLVNCAGFFPTCDFEDITAEAWRSTIDVNLTGPFLMIKATLPLMKGHGWGRIINFGSASVFEGVPVQAPYVAAKAGVVGLSRSLARAIGQEGITVNVVTPGLTITPQVREVMPAALIDRHVQLRAIKREEKPEDLVGTVFFLASPDADFISGQTINVDGGKQMP